MSVIVLDYFEEFDRTLLNQLVDVGCREVLLFDFWHLHEPQEGQYRFDSVVRYARNCRNAGLVLRVQSPIGAPLWAPKTWFLRNARGDYSNFLRHSIPNQLTNLPTLSYEAAITIGVRTLSYWNSDAESALRRYVLNLKSALATEGAICIPSIGSCGEYIFPPVYFFPFLESECSPWWFDGAAKAAWQRYAETEENARQEDWLFATVSAMTTQRLELYDEKWLQYNPYVQGWGNFGNDGIHHVVEQNSAGLKTILFTVFKPNLSDAARTQAAHYPTWGGAEGADNIVANSRRAFDLGLRGVICGPLWFDYGRESKPTMFEQLRIANEYWKRAHSATSEASPSPTRWTATVRQPQVR